MEQVGDRQRMPMPEANTARYVAMGPRQTMGEQGYPTGVAGVAEERGRCSAERSCCRPQARRCLSHFTVGHKRVMLQARWRLSPMCDVRARMGITEVGPDGDRTPDGYRMHVESAWVGGWSHTTFHHFAKFQSDGGATVVSSGGA
jgi:hypothetical protein